MISISQIAIVALALFSHVPIVYSFSLGTALIGKTSRFQQPLKARAEVPLDSNKEVVHIEAIGCAGLTQKEVSIALDVANEALHDNFGIEFITDNVCADSNPAVPKSIHGATGRVLLLSLNNIANDWTLNDERLEPFKNAISQQMDSLVGNGLSQPILVSVQPSFRNRNNDATDLQPICQAIVEKEVTTYGLRSPMVVDAAEIGEKKVTMPREHVEIDGAMVPDPYTNEEHFDTSSILVFDDFVDSDLRERLLDVVNKREGGAPQWNDKSLGPDPKRWIRGGEESFN